MEKRFIIRNQEKFYVREGSRFSWLHEDHYPLSMASSLTKREAGRIIEKLDRIYFGSYMEEAQRREK
jgi:hypothetical protein|tara:strand:- start:2580 stop:2780 length:201 start_codon:yes stop_codon:yes gene_type:complete